MRVVLNYKSFLKSSATPMTPLYTGSWNPKFATKWLGVAAELSYNPYLRNGWVAVDTGVKGAVGSPLIEFSTWEAENSTYNIVIPNSFSYRFLFRKDVCVSKFLARSSVEASEWWFLAGGANSILNLWGRKLSPANRVRAQFKAITYLNYRFRNLNSVNKLEFFGAIPVTLNAVLGVNAHDFRFRDLSINFLYLNKITRHRVARIRFFLYERGIVSNLLGKVGSFTLFSFFTERFFFQVLQKQVNLVRTVDVLGEGGEFRFFNRTPLLFFSFEQLVGNLSTAIFFFLEFKETPALFNFFLILLRRLTERLVFLFAVSLDRVGDFSRAWLIQLSTFVVRRLISFLLTTYLSVYSFLILVVHMVREFVLRTLSSVPSSPVLLSGGRSNNLIALYSYKLRQLSSSLAINLISTDKLAAIFPITKISTSTLLREYARHRGRGIRLFRRRRSLFRRKKKFNFVGRWPKNYFYKKRVNPSDEDVGFIFSRRLYQLRRILKFSSSGGQFTFLFFWSFQFFNFGQLNLKKRKFFFLAMRLAYFFKSFLRFFKFYAFYFKLLREWDLSDREIYSNTDNFVVNLKTYCALLFLKFGRVLVNFKIFCEKIFLLKWKRFCVMSLNDLQGARRTLITSFNWASKRIVSSTGRSATTFLRKKVPVALIVKFLAWSYSAFTNIYSAKVLSDTAISSRRYLRYLLKLRLMYANLHISRVGYVLQNAIAGNSHLNDVPQYLLEASLSSWFARSFWKLPFRARLGHSKSMFLGLIGRVLSTSTTLVFFYNGVLYFKRGVRSVLRKISPVYIRKLFRRCLVRRRRFNPWISVTTVLRKRQNWSSSDIGGVFGGNYMRFIKRLRSYSGLTFTSIAKRVFSDKNLGARLLNSSSYVFAKRALLVWKTFARVFLQQRYLQASKFGGTLLSVRQLSFLFSSEIGRTKLLSLLRDRSISADFRTYSFSSFNPRWLTSVSVGDAKACQEQFLVFDLAMVERVALQSMHAVLSSISGLKTGLLNSPGVFNSLYGGSFGLLFTTLPGRLVGNIASAGAAKPFVSDKPCNLSSKNVFLEIWGLYLTVDTWSTGALDIVRDRTQLRGSLTNLLLFYGVACGLDFENSPFSLFLTCFVYLRAQFSAIRSFAVLKVGILRSELFNGLANVYLRAYFFRNFFFTKKHSKLVISEALTPLRLFSAGTKVRNTLSFSVLYKLTNWFGQLVLERLETGGDILVGATKRVQSTSQVIRKTCAFTAQDFRVGNSSFSFNCAVTKSRIARSALLQISSRSRRTARRHLQLSVSQPTMSVFSSAVVARLNIASRVWRAYRWIKHAGPLNVLFNPAAAVNRIIAVNYLRNILYSVGHVTVASNRAGPIGLSQRSYSWRIGKFFNLLRSMHPLQLLVYAKKMGIWPKHLRLRPKRVKQKRVFEINPSKNKQSLVPDKNFKMPPSIFSRDNYDSMNLILDFPNEDYRFARVNTYKWVRAWRFTRNLAARKLIVFMRRRLKIRYFKRTFRYRRFLRKRRFRNKLKKIAYRAIIRASTKLRALQSLKVVYRGGSCLRSFSAAKVYYSPILTHSLVVARFFKGLYARFLRAKVTLRAHFMRFLKLQFLFLLSVSFFKKMLSFFASFIWVYRLTFSGDTSFAWCFNKLNSLLLVAIRMYSLGASYYWTEPLALFNTKLLLNYSEEEFFKVRRLPDFFVIRTIGPAYYPYHTLIASLPWRTDSVQLFQPYRTFLASSLFNTVVSRFVLAATDLRAVLENFNVFEGIIEGEFFQTCGFRMRLPFRRRGNKVVQTSRAKVYLKPIRRAQVIRLLRKLVILRARHKSKKMLLNLSRKSRDSLSRVSYIDNSRSFFKSLLRLRPIYITLPKYGVNLKHYRMWCRIVRVIANARRHAWPARLNVAVSGELYYCRTTRRYIKHRRLNSRFGKYRVRMHWRQRKFFARRQAIFNMPSVLETTPGSTRANARLSRWKQPNLFSRSTNRLLRNR